MVAPLSFVFTLMSFYLTTLAYSQVELMEALENCKGQTLCYMTFPPPLPPHMAPEEEEENQKQEEEEGDESSTINTPFDFVPPIQQKTQQLENDTNQPDTNTPGTVAEFMQTLAPPLDCAYGAPSVECLPLETPSFTIVIFMYLFGAVVGAVVIWTIITLCNGVEKNMGSTSIEVNSGPDKSSLLFEASDPGSNYSYSFLKHENGEEQCFIRTN